MRSPTPQRDARSGEHGLTLIELLVTIALMTVSVVFIVGAFANSERAAATTTDQSNTEVAMRQITDYVRQTYVATEAPGYQGLQYVFCAKNTTYVVPGVIGTTKVLSASGGPVTAWSITVTNGQGADRKASNGSLLPAPPPFMDCANGQFNPTSCSSGNCDWGVQQLTIKITFKSNRSLTRTIFKSEVI